jgi:hypothetical protein
MMNDFLVWFLDYVQYFLILPVFVSVLMFKKLNYELKVIFYFLLLSVFFEFVSRFLGYLKFKNTLPLLHLYTILEFSFIWWFYYRFFKNFYSQKVMIGVWVTFVILAILNSAFIQKLDTFNTYARGLESVGVIVMTIFAFNKLLAELDNREPTYHPVFWINAGYLFYFAGSMVVFILSNYFLSDNNLLLVAWGIHAILLAIMYCFISLGLWQLRRQ